MFSFPVRRLRGDLYSPRRGRRCARGCHGHQDPSVRGVRCAGDGGDSGPAGRAADRAHARSSATAVDLRTATRLNPFSPEIASFKARSIVEYPVSASQTSMRGICSAFAQSTSPRLARGNLTSFTPSRPVCCRRATAQNKPCLSGNLSPVPRLNARPGLLGHFYPSTHPPAYTGGFFVQLGPRSKGQDWHGRADKRRGDGSVCRC